MGVNHTELVRLVRRGKLSEKRGKALRGFLAIVSLKVARDLMTGWLVMLAVGVARAEWTPALPTIGYWWAALLVALTRGLFTAVPRKAT